MSLVIRKIEPSDAEAWLQCRLEGLKSAPSAFSSSYEEEAVRTVADIEKRLAAGAATKSASFGAFSSGFLAGTVSLYHKPHIKEAHKMDLWGVYVRPQFRGQKISRKLTEYAINYARAVGGIEIIQLSVETSNKEATGLYKSLGFKSFGIERKALKINGQYFDMESMSLEL